MVIHSIKKERTTDGRTDKMDGLRAGTREKEHIKQIHYYFVAA